MENLESLPGTGAVGKQLNPPLTEAQVNAILRRRGEIVPPVVRGRRRWRPEDVEALRRYVTNTSRLAEDR